MKKFFQWGTRTISIYLRAAPRYVKKRLAELRAPWKEFKISHGGVEKVLLRNGLNGELRKKEIGSFGREKSQTSCGK